MNFNLLAPHYDWLEAVTAGSRLQRARTRWLEALAGCKHVLSVGEGHGRFAAAFLERFPQAKLTCVEASPGMLALARRRTRPWEDRVRWECADALAWQAVQKYDAVVTCFFLDCFPPDTLATIVRHVANAASAHAIWLMTDFAMPPAGLARWRAQGVHSLMYGFFRLVTRLPARRVTQPDGLLAAQGFELRRRQAFEWGLISADLWQRGGTPVPPLPF
jgi:SAM-dependent methyltransferase